MIYKVVDERRHITRSEDSQIYALEHLVCDAIQDVLNHRVLKYGENKYKEALPSTWSALLVECFDNYAGYVGARDFILQYLINRDEMVVARKLMKLLVEQVED